MKLHWFGHPERDAERNAEIRCYFDKVFRDRLARSDAPDDAGE